MSTPVLRLIEDGAPGRLLPAWTKLQLGTDDGSEATLLLNYAASDPTAKLLADQVEVVVMVDGVELADGRFTLDESQSDEVVDEATDVWKGISTLGQLRYARVYPVSWPSTGVMSHPMSGATPGWALRELLERAQARGALRGLLWDFTDGLDSSGQAWPRTTTETLEVGKTYLEVVENWFKRDLAVARVQDGVLQLFAYGRQGTDRTNEVQLLRGRDLLSGPVNSSTRDTVSVMLAATDEMAIERDSASALSRFGRREGFLSQTMVDESTLTSIADGTMALTARQRESYTYELALPESGPQPFRDFDRGDIVEVRVKERDRVMRVRQLAVEWEADGSVTGEVTFGDRYADANEQIRDRLEQLTSGSMDGGAYGAPVLNSGSFQQGEAPTYPGEVGRDTIAPRGPTNMRVLGIAYQATGGSFQVDVTVAWDPVEYNVDGSQAIDISYYKLQIIDSWDQPVVNDLWQPSLMFEPEQTTATLTLRPNTYYWLRVRAVDWWGNNSAWSETGFETGRDESPPEAAPSAPGVAPVLFGALRVSFDGLDEHGYRVADDASHVEVHAATSAGFTPSDGTRMSTIPIPDDGKTLDTVITDLQPGTTYYVRLVLVDVWGNESEPGPTGSGTPVDVTADPGEVGPENLSFSDYGNLVPDGSFERPEFRTLLTAGRFEEGAAARQWTAPSQHIGFVQDTGNNVVLDVDMTAEAWRNRENLTPPATGPDGLVKDGTTHSRWSTVDTVPFDPNTLYKVSMRVRVDRESTSGGGTFYGAIESKNANGNWLNNQGADSVYFMQEAVASGRNMRNTTGQWRTWTGYVRGTAPTPVPLREGPYNDPARLPAGTAQFGLQTTIDHNAGNGRWTLGQVQVETPAPTVHGDWALEFRAGGQYWQRAVLARIESPSPDTQYYIRFWVRLVGPRPSDYLGVLGSVDFYHEDGITPVPLDNASNLVAKQGGWDHDGWYLVEGRVERDQDAQFAQVARAEVYIATVGLSEGQRVQVDAVEVRQVATNVLIGDAAIDDAKIKSLSASKITAGTINSVVTVSGRIATATTGARVELDSTGLKGYDSTNNKTASIETESGKAQFTGVMGDMTVEGRVVARNSSSQLGLLPTGWNSGGYQWPSINLSPGLAPLEKAPAAIAGTSFGIHGIWFTQGMGFQTLFTTPYMRIDGAPNPSGMKLELALPQDHTVMNENTGDVEVLRGHAAFQFPQPIQRLDNGGEAIIENHWQNNRWLPFRGGPAAPGEQISFTGKTSYGQRAGMVIVKDSETNLEAVWIDFRRDGYSTSPNTGATTFVRNHLWCGIRADVAVVRQVLNHASESEYKSAIEDVPFNAVDVVRANPSRQWEHNDHPGEKRLGPMADDMPEPVSVYHDTAGNWALSLDNMIGVLWKATEELDERIKRLEAE